MTPDDILAALQRAFDTVQGEHTRVLGPDDELVADLALDSLDFIDLVMTLEADLPADQIDALIEQVGALRTVGDVVDCLLARGAPAA